MKAGLVTVFICRWAVAPGSLLVSAYGVYLFEGADFGRDRLEMSLYCGLPFLSFPVFLLSFWSLRWSVAMHWIIAAGYLAVYSTLDWRTCAEMGYCHGIMRVIEALRHARLLLPLLCLFVASYSTILPQPQQLDEQSIIRGIDAAVQMRLDAIVGYTVIEHYTVYRNSDETHPAAERTVKTTYIKGAGKNYDILSDSGSDLIRKLVLDAILDNEKRINQPGATDHSYIVSANYEMKLQPGGPQSLNGRECYVLSIRPREKAPNLIVGTLWVDTRDESIVQLQGVTSKSVSIFTGPTQVMRQYTSVDGFAEATHARGASSSMLFGQTVVTIDYRDYEIKIRDPK